MKKKLIVPAVLFASALGMGTAFAVFSGGDKSDFVAEFGTVEIGIEDINLTNADKISPGNGDRNNPDKSIGNTDHNFEFTINNKGNKSIRTRYTIVLSALNSGKVLDASQMMLSKGGDEIADKEYLDIRGKSVSASSGEVAAVKYTIEGDIFDGFGKDILDGGDAEKEGVSGGVEEDKNGDVKKSYSFDFALLRTAKNEYQNADIHIDVVAEAMQYRNTKDSDFSDIVVKKSYSTQEFDGDFVPSKDEDKDGEEF